MKLVKCPSCKAERVVQNNVIMSVCKCCMVEMVVIDKGIKSKEEVLEIVKRVNNEGN